MTLADVTPRPAHPGTDGPTLADLPVPAKVLLSMILLTLALALLGALGQIVVHDIIPTFFNDEAMPHGGGSETTVAAPPAAASERGDLFGAEPAPAAKPPAKPFYQEAQFVWLLKWTHIHLFGMSMIFVFQGVVTIFLDMSVRARSWLVALPFAGVLVDIAAMWLKAYVSPAFFWLHLPGGGLFAAVFAFVFLRGLTEMWRQG
jgi:hypothetical protein